MEELSRVSIAVAACVCSFDETKLEVKEEHVKWAKGFLKACYGSDLFNLERHVNEEKAYDTCDATDIQSLQGMYNRNPSLLVQMERNTSMDLKQMQAMAGGDQQEFHKIYSRLIECNFVHQEGNSLRPSGKFRKAFRQINKNTTMKRV
jgi:hypothetical protein